MTATLVFTILFAFAVNFLLCIEPAQAYLDPGSGSYIYYFIVSGLLGAGAILKLYWQKLRDFARRVLGG